MSDFTVSHDMQVRAARVPHGHVQITGPWGELVTGDTLSCCHCRAHWIVEAGSGKKRGFCTNCMGYTCGREACNVCIPFEQRLENLEAGRPELTPRPAQILVPRSV